MDTEIGQGLAEEPLKEPIIGAPARKKRRRGLWIALASVALVMAMLLGVLLWLVLGCYSADTEAIAAFGEAHDFEVMTKGAYTVISPKEPKAGLIFYPGARVEHEAYLPLMEACAEAGILCVLVEMPLCFPLIAPDMAEGARALCPEIERWYIAGHSLGGFSAGAYLSENAEKYEGLILLASYVSADLTDSGLDVLCVYGSEDRIMNKERYEEGLALLPADAREYMIAGGCHAYFGMYLGQDRDAAVGVTNEQQIYLTASVISEFVNGEK